MKFLLLLAALAAVAPASAAEAGRQTARAVLRQERLLLLGAAQDWKDYLARAPEAEREKFSAELAAIKSDAQAADGMRSLRAAQLRLDAWRRGLLGELFPFLPAALGETGALGSLAGARVEAVAAIEAAEGGGRLSPERRAVLDALKRRVCLAVDRQALDQLFDNAGLARPAPAAAAAFAPAARLGPAVAAVVKARFPGVPLPEALSASDHARFAPVVEALRRRGASPAIIDLTIREAIRQRVDPLLVLAMIANESDFKPGATSRVGARGLMQIMPRTGRGLGVRDPDLLYDPGINVRAGVTYLKWLWGEFSDFSFSALSTMDPFASSEVKNAVVAYNAGPGAVRRYGAVPPYRETRRYVSSVLQTYVRLRDIYASAG
ncbi:MAG: lytic transglycosylase domain-containing protein [Elusimicrobia bacterium]|nr:lytic transglycosylase domain-containing protein [Elusimicrobiota bacterium]